MVSIKDLENPSNSLKASDLEGDEITLKIKSYEVREFEQTSKKGEQYIAKKPILSFEGTEKTLVCNLTNMRAIAHVYGNDIDGWIGKEITLYPTMVSFGHEMVEAIRVRVIKQGKGKPKFLQNESNLDDDIPF